MDRNSITGIILITIILAFFWWVNKPSEQELAEQQRRRDSIATVEIQKAEAERQAKALQLDQQNIQEEVKDSTVLAQEQSNRYGLFAEAAMGEQSFITLENELIRMTLSSKGARVYSVELKQYKNYDESPVILMDGEQNRFGFNFIHNSRVFHTNDLFFKVLPHTNPNQIDFEVDAEEGKMIFSYVLPENSYMVDFNITIF